MSRKRNKISKKFEGTFDKIDAWFAAGHTVEEVATLSGNTRRNLWEHHASAIRRMVALRRIPDRAILHIPVASLGLAKATRNGKLSPNP